MSNIYEINFLYSLLFTVSVELTVIYVLTYYFQDKGTYTKVDILFAGVIPSVTTLPYLWFVLPIFFIGNHTLYVAVGEISVSVIETLMLYKLLLVSLKRAFVYASLANLASFSLGYIFT